METKEKILSSLKPLFEEAITGGKWFYSVYHGVYFTPAELHQYHLNGQFIWGVKNWELRIPFSYENQLKNQIKNLEYELSKIKSRSDFSDEYFKQSKYKSYGINGES